MSLKSIVMAGLAATALSGGALADDTYRCGDQICHDDQADETRRLNEMQLENPGAGIDAVPPPGYDDSDAYDTDRDDTEGQGGPYDPSGDDENYPPGQPGDNPDSPYGEPSDEGTYGEEPSDEGSYDDEPSDDDAYPSDDDPDDDGDPDDAPYPQ